MSAHPLFEDMFAKIFGVPAPRMVEPMRPDDLDVIHMDNEAIDDIKESHERAEIIGQLPRMDYGTIADVESDIKGAHDDDRR